MKLMPSELRRVFRPMVVTMIVSFVVMLLSVASLFYTTYRFLVVEGHSQGDAPPAAIAAAVWGSIGIEIVAAVVFVVAGLVILRAGFLRWWSRKGLIQRWWEHSKQKAGQ